MKFPFFKQNNQLEVKENPVGHALFVAQRYTSSLQKTKDYACDGYQKNVIVYRCIREIATGASTIKLLLKRKKGDDWQNVESHPIITLLNKPNPANARSSFIRDAISDYLYSGNMFLARFPDKGNPAEMWTVDPIQMKVIAGKKGLPSRYVFSEGEGKVTFPVNQFNGKSAIFHFKTYNPMSDFVGQSPLMAAALAADQHNEGMLWNYSLLRNSARRSGILKFKDNPSKEVINRLREFFKSKVQGAKNAGEVGIIAGDGEWQDLDNSPKDMDFIQSLKLNESYIAHAYGVPLPLVSNDASTFNNYKEAKERLYTDTICPLLNDLLESFSPWLVDQYGLNPDEYILTYDQDSIPALEGVRSVRADRVRKDVQAGLITPNEGREMLGMPPIDGAGDTLYVPSNLVPIDFVDSLANEGAEQEKMLKLFKSFGYSDDEIKSLGYDSDKTKCTHHD